jgi:hypothetical protein
MAAVSPAHRQVFGLEDQLVVIVVLRWEGPMEAAEVEDPQEGLLEAVEVDSQAPGRREE